MPYIFGKLWHLAIIWAIRKAFQCILQGVRILLAKYTRISPTSENESYRHLSGWSPFWEPISDTCCAKHRSDYSLIDSGCKPSNPYVLTENYIVQYFKNLQTGSFSMTNLSTFIYWWVRSLWCRKTASKFTQIGIALLKLALSWCCRNSLTTTYIHT